jgi:cell wall-associated NlpC family hydrolase
MRGPAIILASLALVLALPAYAAKPKPERSWAHAEIELVVADGLMAPDAASFRPDDPLTQGELAELVAGLTGRPVAPPADPAATVTMAGLDARLVRALGLQAAAAATTRDARLAGLAPPSRFGNEVVARLLGLRTNHPAARDALERLPNEPAPRAEAAFSAARILRLTDPELELARATVASLALDVPDPVQRRVLATAFRFVGFPYVWGGESERPAGADGPYGPQAQGGFDCSGFVWRVFKLQPYAEAPALAAVLKGRTTFAMSREVPRSARIPFARLRPADVVFFGAKGPRSKPAQVDHTGIYAGNGWMVHSSGFGVTLVPLAGWYRQHFAWARRPLAEAGLAETPSIPA